MGYIELTFCGDWKKLPDLKTRFKISFSKRDGELTQDILFVGERAQSLDADDIRKIRSHRGVIRAELEFEEAPFFGPAIEALQLARHLFGCGGTGLFVDTATKVFTPRTLGEITTDEPRFLFHFLVEVFGNREAITTSGMTAFGLPDVRVPYSGDMVGPAQSAAFSLAAKMVCDQFVPLEGSPFRASESAPLYEMSRDARPSQDNPLGFWTLRLPEGSA